jgi:hypothetical protein
MKKTVLLCLVLFGFSALADVQMGASRIDGALAWGVWGDFNGDGLDEVMRNNRLQWNVAGRLTAPVTLPQFDEHSAFLLEAVDLNADRFADIVKQDGEGVPDRLFLGDGAGGFTEYSLPAQFGRVMKMADFTNDGHPDLLMTSTGKLTILRNDGAANFTLHQELPWKERELFPDIGLGDLNGDGTIDFAVASEARLYVYTGNAEGFFGEPRVRFTRRPFAFLAIGDVTGDARGDLSGVHSFQGKDGPVVLTGDGGGRFPVAIRHRTETQFTNDSLVVGDFVEGGAKEIAYAAPDGTVHILTAMNGAIRELGSTPIDAAVKPWVDNVGPRLLVRHFRSAGRQDLIVEAYSMDVYANPPRRLWLIDVQGSLSSVRQSSFRSRVRPSAGFADRVTGDYRVDILESTCPITLSALEFEREGMFVDVALSEQIRGADAIFVDGSLWVRLTVMSSGIPRELSGTLRPQQAGGYTGTLYENAAETPCGGLGWHRVALTVER